MPGGIGLRKGGRARSEVSAPQHSPGCTQRAALQARDDAAGGRAGWHYPRPLHPGRNALVHRRGREGLVIAVGHTAGVCRYEAVVVGLPGKRGVEVGRHGLIVASGRRLPLGGALEDRVPGVRRREVVLEAPCRRLRGAVQRAGHCHQRPLYAGHWPRDGPRLPSPEHVARLALRKRTAPGPRSPVPPGRIFEVGS